MISTRELLEAAKSARGLPSNYRLARELDVPEKTVQRWNTGKNSPDDVHAAQLAELAGLDPAEVVVSIRAERSTEPAMRSLWEGIAKKLERAGVPLALLFAVILSAFFGFDGGPDAGAALLSSVAISAENGLYIMSTHRWGLPDVVATAAPGSLRLVDPGEVCVTDRHL
ncbi:DUF3693 domain-containing protein [Methylibium petroleiphilum]|uniref:Uncharacterized protein n=1 Tax=Methylibium petroleiphilum (strain ATCC BAA-1232 / LMG 22953 / PM1) TaxID=420662 RepID=A2SGV3_METPP|nr:DUF3693 domain-containing protein [Methylibium petroleiphilum]ABM94792.1 hypothetical protein Mpe_A1834 [Methylibium petroleiphilum PM1]